MSQPISKAVPILAALFLTVPALAGATTDVQGDWAGPVVSKVRVQGVGGDTARSTDFATVGAGTWLSHNSVGWVYAGTWSASGKKLSWNYDAQSRVELEDMLDAWAAAEGAPDADTSVTDVRTKAKARESRRGKRLTVKSKVKFEAFIAGKNRRGKFRSTTKFVPE